MSENKIIENLPAPRYQLVFVTFELYDRYSYYVTSAMPDEKGFKLTFEKYPGKNGQVSDAMIDAITASLTPELFKIKYSKDESLRGNIRDTIYISDGYARYGNVQVIWDNKDYSYYALSIDKQIPGNNTENHKFPLARVPFGASRENGGFYLSRLIALMKKYKEKDIAINILGSDFVSNVLTHNKHITTMLMTAEDPSKISKEALAPSNDLYVRYSLIRKLSIALEKAEEKSNDDKPAQSRYCLIRESNHHRTIYNTKSKKFLDDSNESFQASAVPIQEIDKLTMGYSGASKLDEALDQYGESEYYIATLDGENGITRECEPLYKVRALMFDGIRDILDGIDAHGFYAGSDDNHTLLKMIREYGYHIMNYENINSSMPFVSTYPYISYDDIRVMMREIIKQKEEVTPSVIQSLNIKPDYQSGTQYE